MTATVAVLGLLPASLSTGIGSDVQRPLATVIVYGLLFATVLRFMCFQPYTIWWKSIIWMKR